MILGVAIRNYKVYKKLQYVPISFGSAFSSFLGPNGIGKTSIFEVLDRFFNGGDWSPNNESKKSEDDSTYVAPLFLIPINEISLGRKGKKLASILSEYYWNCSISDYDPLVTQVKDAALKCSGPKVGKDTHYLIMLGKKYISNEIHIAHFESDIKAKILADESGASFADLGDLLNDIKKYYRYVYLPVEANSVDFTKMESMYVQKLLDENIVETIQNSISKESIDGINKNLDVYVSQINDRLDKYAYKPSWKYRLTINDLVDKIILSYFGARELNKKNQEKNTSIKHLSSGEKRQALIDLSYALISKSEKKKYQIILAIDEPDASMHVAACHDQFEKITKIPDLCHPNPQVLINTHWYGFLPIIRSGIAHSLSLGADSIDFFSFDLENFREHINQEVKKTSGKYPKEVELKSYQDMIQSVVVSMLRDKPYNWIFCEGHSDKIYLEHYLSDLIANINLRVVPLGGFKQVRRVYTYLVAPLADKEAGFKGKALCLVDTDAQKEHVDVHKEIKNLFFKRLVRDESIQKVLAVDTDNQMSFPTEIEFALREEVFNILVENPERYKDLVNFDVLIKILSETDICIGSNNLYDYLNLGPKHKKEIMDSFFDKGNNKVNFAKAYVGSDIDKKYEPDWIATIRAIMKS